MVVNRCFMVAWFELETVEDRIVPEKLKSQSERQTYLVLLKAQALQEQLAPVWEFSRSMYTFPGTVARNGIPIDLA